MAGDRHLAHGISEFAVLDPEAGGAATAMAGDAVDARADQIGDVETLLDVGDQLGRRLRAGFKVQIIRPRRRRGGDAAMGMAGGGATERTRGAQSSSQVVSTPSSISAIFFTATPSASNVCERRPRLRRGSSTMRMFFANSCWPSLSFRKLVLRAIEAPLMAPTTWPTSDPATRGSNTTGTLQVSTLRGFARATVRSPAERPTISGDSKSEPCGAAVKS